MRFGLGMLWVVGITACGGNVGGEDPPKATAGTGGKLGGGGNGGAGNGGGGNGGIAGVSGVGAAGGVGPVGAGGGGTGGIGTGGTAGTGTLGTGGSGGVPWEVTLEMDPFTVDPGADTYMCQNFANPFGGVPVEIAEFETHMTDGSHHLVLNYADGTTSTGPTRCGGLEAPTGPFATQVRDDRLVYPEGIAAPLSGTQGFRINSHYFNPSRDAFQAKVTVRIRRAAPETVRAHALTSLGLDLSINIPPGQTGQEGSTISFGEEVRLLSLMPHMHMHGTRFVVDAGAERILETTDWEAAPVVYDPPLAIAASQSLNYTCSYMNNTSLPLTFGEQAANNEMCILIAQYYTMSDFNSR